MAKGDDIQKRLIDFAVSIINLTTKLSKSSAEKHVAGQILRSGTSPAPNYAESHSAASAKDFKKTAGIPVGLLRIFGNPWHTRDRCRSS